MIGRLSVHQCCCPSLISLLLFPALLFPSLHSNEECLVATSVIIPTTINRTSVRQFSSVAQSCPTLCDPMKGSTKGFPVLHHLLELTQTHVHIVADAIQPSHPLSSPLLLPSIFPSIRVFSNKLALGIRWPKYWSFSFSISPSNRYSGWIFFRIIWFDLLEVQGTL